MAKISQPISQTTESPVRLTPLSTFEKAFVGKVKINGQDVGKKLEPHGQAPFPLFRRLSPGRSAQAGQDKDIQQNRA